MELTDNIRAVLEFYSSLGNRKAFCELKHYNGNTEEYLYSRLERAAFDQCDGNNIATFSRYAIWADDVRYLIKSAIESINTQDKEKAVEELTLALNALGAFVDIQNMFDAQPGRMQFEKPEQIFKEYKEFKKL
ncbi:MAG TPA: hypothetical protein PLA73_09435 [Sedimentibacter sp.]|nr:hypothetical protein [Clostridia bacterium]HQK54442.1 hypothetical protein [Sedimentibacter sp.]